MMVELAKKAEINKSLRGCSTELCPTRINRYTEVEGEDTQGKHGIGKDVGKHIVYLCYWQDWSEQSRECTPWAANVEFSKMRLNGRDLPNLFN